MKIAINFALAYVRAFFVVVSSLYIEKDILQYLLSINGVMKIEL